MEYLHFFKGKNVFVTGHTGFKGTWLCAMLVKGGAVVTGYSDRTYELFDASDVKGDINSIRGDVRDGDMLSSAMRNANPDIVFHLAAQPLVRESYKDPCGTYSTNVMGTVNVLEAVRQCNNAGAVVNITTDKVYKNLEQYWGYRENDALGSDDPYSNSKACSELVTAAYRASFFSDGKCRLVTARAGNVIGGGDYAADRIIPDCVKAALSHQPIIVRNKTAVRPWQNVLDPLSGYLTLAQATYLGENASDSYNFGPHDADCVDVGALADMFCTAWGAGSSWEYRPEQNAVHESKLLKLDTSLAASELGWSPVWNIRTAVEKTVEWYRCAAEGELPRYLIDKQISEHLRDAEK